MIGGVYLLRIRCFGRPAVVRTRRVTTRGYGAIDRGAIVLVVAERLIPWPTPRPIRYAMRITAVESISDGDGGHVLELSAADVWRLGRPFHLADVLGAGAPYPAHAPLVRLSNVHEQIIRNGGWLSGGGRQVDRPDFDEPVRELFLKLWSKGAGAPDYDKAQWGELRGLLAERGIET